LNVRFDRVGNSFPVIALLKFRNEVLSLQTADDGVGEFIFEVRADLREILAVIDRD
jgi:hypothetical protein